MARFIRVIAVVAAVLLASCQTLPDEPLMLEDALKANVAPHRYIAAGDHRAASIYSKAGDCLGQP